MVETPAGLVIPKLDADLCTECGLCDLVCPQMSVPATMQEHLASPYVGPIQGAYLGGSSAPAVAAQGQTGGLVRSLLAFSLESGLADAAVCVVDRPEHPLRPAATLIRSPAEALAVSRSKYCPIPVNALLSDMLEFDGRLAYVGLACHMQGLSLALEHLPKLRAKIALRIGLFCDRVLTFAAVDYLLRCARAAPQNVTAFDYRHQAWKGWPGNTRVVTRDGRVRNVPRRRRIDSIRWFTPTPCRLCIDKLNALADLSLGDPYGLTRGKKVPTAAIVRTETGNDLLQKAHKAGVITLSPADVAAMTGHQGNAERVARCLMFGREMLHRGYELPEFLKTAPITVTKEGPRPLRVRWAVGFADFAETPTGAWMIRRIPWWIPLLWGAPRRWYRMGRAILAGALKRLTGSHPGRG